MDVFGKFDQRIVFSSEMCQISQGPQWSPMQACIPLQGNFGRLQAPHTTHLELLHDGVDDGRILDEARSDPVAALDYLVASNLYQRDRLGIARLESYRCTGGDVESVAVCSNAIEL